MLYLQSRKTKRYIRMCESGFYGWVKERELATPFKDRTEINQKCNHIYNEVVNGLDIAE
jgi:hypothetical protein